MEKRIAHLLQAGDTIYYNGQNQLIEVIEKSCLHDYVRIKLSKDVLQCTLSAYFLVVIK